MCNLYLSPNHQCSIISKFVMFGKNFGGSTLSYSTLRHSFFGPKVKNSSYMYLSSRLTLNLLSLPVRAYERHLLHTLTSLPHHRQGSSCKYFTQQHVIATDLLYTALPADLEQLVFQSLGIGLGEEAELIELEAVGVEVGEGERGPGETQRGL